MALGPLVSFVHLIDAEPYGERSCIHLSRRGFIAGTTLAALGMPAHARAQPSIPLQPYFASVARAVAALAAGGQPIARPDADELAALAASRDKQSYPRAEALLDSYTLVHITMEADGYPRAVPAGALPILNEQGWSLFLVRVTNPIGSTENLAVSLRHPSPIARSTNAQRSHLGRSLNRGPALADAWLTPQMYTTHPMAAKLSGSPVEYLIVQIYARDRGRKSAYLNFTAGGDPWVQRLDLARRGATIAFNSRPSRDVFLRILDHDGIGCVGSLIIRDGLDRIYPLQAMRIAPDLFFQPQIYRADRETVRLPDGQYVVEAWRGPEYIRDTHVVQVSPANSQIEIKLRRWIEPARWGWYSGDTHIHAAGCSHYSTPSEGISPETVIRHVRGEGLYLGNVLTWGPGWYYQKQFFSGHAISPEAVLEHPELQQANQTSLKPKPTPKDDHSLLRYDVEVSGFPSAHSGHLVLLRLKEQDFPGTKTIEEWPSWTLPILQWARGQGAVAGFAHCGERMSVGTTQLPNYEIPPMDGVGANEAIVDVTHDAVDFLSGGEWLPANELNTWYHMLNCGFRLPMVGETDFPCLSADRPGFGRSYVRLASRPVGDAGYDAWVRAMRAGHLYFGDGRSHFIEFRIGRSVSGEELRLRTRRRLVVEASVAAWLEPKPTSETEAIRSKAPFAFPQWHLERARVADTRDVPVELVVNGQPTARKLITADGALHRIRLEVEVAQSSWVALRILPSGHTHPVFVTVAGKPVRGSRRSAEWLLACVERLWEIKHQLIRESERPAAAAAYDHARRRYRSIIAESEAA